MYSSDFVSGPFLRQKLRQHQRISTTKTLRCGENFGVKNHRISGFCRQFAQGRHQVRKSTLNTTSSSRPKYPRLTLDGEFKAVRPANVQIQRAANKMPIIFLVNAAGHLRNSLQGYIQPCAPAIMNVAGGSDFGSAGIDCKNGISKETLNSTGALSCWGNCYL